MCTRILRVGACVFFLPFLSWFQIGLWKTRRKMNNASHFGNCQKQQAASSTNYVVTSEYLMKTSPVLERSQDAVI